MGTFILQKQKNNNNAVFITLMEKKSEKTNADVEGPLSLYCDIN